MRIKALEFENGEGARFAVTAQNITEQVLLQACVDTDVLENSGYDVDVFYLTLPVSN